MTMNVRSNDADKLREWDNAHVWHPFTPMSAHRDEDTPIIVEANGFDLIDADGVRYLDGISSLWCNVHGHRVPEIDDAIRNQLNRVSHTTLLGLCSDVSIELARRLVEITPASLTKVFYSDSGATAVEAALKIAYQYHQQKTTRPKTRDLFVCVGQAYHGDTIGSVSVGGIDVFHRVYRHMLFPTATVPSPVALHVPDGYNAESWLAFCFDEVERVLKENHERAAALVIEPLVQGAAGILVHPPGYLAHVRRLCTKYDVPMIADEVAVGFGRTGRMFACEHEDVQPDIMCLAKGITGGVLPLAATLATDEIFDAFLGAPSEGRTFFHGHTYTGNALGCAAALASLDLFESNQVMQNVAAMEPLIRERLNPLTSLPHVAEIRQRGIMVGIDLVKDRDTFESYSPELRVGHQVTLAARRRGVILRPLGDVIVLMPAPAMPLESVERLCECAIESIEEVVSSIS